jgi:hypothetical protein
LKEIFDFAAIDQSMSDILFEIESLVKIIGYNSASEL